MRFSGLWRYLGQNKFLHFHGGYIDTKQPAKLFCLILPNKGIMSIFVIFEMSKILFSVT